MNVTISRWLIAASIFALSMPAAAQEEEDPSAIDDLGKSPQAAAVIEVPGAAELRDAMRRIASRPSDSYALTDAGNAALLLGDPNAALNFFTRANSLQPSNGRIKMGLGIASVRTENPFEALRLFDEAVRLGVAERTIAADRALAYDLLGNFVRAQQDYALARTGGASDDLIVQQAISLAIGGKRAEGDAMLAPLLRRNVASAWRARAFLLAARGDYKESSRVTQGFMDARSAQQLERYLRQMPELTGAQQAAAIHLGHFPANNIGRDTDAIRAVASKYPVTGATGAGRLVPSGPPLGANSVGKAAKESSKDRKLRERAEKLAAKAVKNTKAASVVRPAATGDLAPGASPVSNPPGLVTDIARSRILEAEQASVRLVASNAMPPPDNVRPLVTVAPRSEPVQIAAPATAKVMTDVKIANVTRELLPPQPAPNPVPQTFPPQPQSQPQPIISAPVAVVQAPVFAPAVVPPPVVPPPVVPPPAQIQTPALITAPVQIQTPVPIPAPTPAPSAAQFPPSSSIAVPASPVITPPATILTPTPTPTPTGAQDSVPAIPNLVDTSAPQIAAAPIISSPVIASAEPIKDILPAAKAVPASGFSLDDIVGSIEIPESEQQRDIVPVNLKTLKTAAPKPSLAEHAAADKLKASGKNTAKTAVLDSSSRLWVQIATGNTSAFMGDMRNYARKYPALFRGQAAWSAPWGNNSRLVVGPFTDMKMAKKWEADFNKAGGKGFVWRSEKGAEVKPFRGK